MRDLTYDLDSTTYWSIERHVVATTGGAITCCSSCSNVVATRRFARVNSCTSGCICKRHRASKPNAHAPSLLYVLTLSKFPLCGG